MSTPTRPPVHVKTSRRIRIISRRFWPYSGTTEVGVAELAEALQSQGHDVEIVTIAWDRHWPVRFRFRSVEVHRLMRPGGGPWGSYRYLKSLARYLNSEIPDQIILAGLGDELVTLHYSLDRPTPYIVRLDETDFASSSKIDSLTSRQREALREADRVVVDADWNAAALIDQQLADAERVTVGSDAARCPVELAKVDAHDRAVARRTFADAHPMLMVEPDAPLVVAAATMNGDKGWIDLVEAWGTVVRRWPAARLWLIGDGPKSRRIWDAVVKRQLVDSIIMPGQLDNWEEVLKAATLFIHPLRGTTQCSFLIRAMQAGMPAIVSLPLGQALGMEDGRQAALMPVAQPKSLSAILQAVLSDSELTESLGSEAGIWAGERFRLQDRLEQFVVSEVESQR